MKLLIFTFFIGVTVSGYAQDIYFDEATQEVIVENSLEGISKFDEFSNQQNLLRLLIENAEAIQLKDGSVINVRNISTDLSDNFQLDIETIRMIGGGTGFGG